MFNKIIIIKFDQKQKFKASLLIKKIKASLNPKISKVRAGQTKNHINWARTGRHPIAFI